MKLGKRLQQLDAMVSSEEYSHIWDVCCDHGLLGAALLSRQAAAQIHFVDIVPQIMQELENKLQRFYPRSAFAWQIHCIDAGALPLQDFSGRHFIIIAGVGGDLMAQFVTALHRHNPAITFDFLLCPVRHTYTLRQRLIELDFSLKQEVLIEDNQRYYEILRISSAPTEGASAINPVGDQIWQADNAEQGKIAERYLKKTLDHYRRIQSGGKANVQVIIDAYRAIRL